MRRLIDAYRIHPGEHCGSASMRGLLEFYAGLELPEPAVFGLGGGVATALLQGDAFDPPVMLFGRPLTLEQDLGRHLAIDYREQEETDDDEAWRVVREEVIAGRPTMLSGDIFYLDYRDYTVHFPGHRFVLVGFDDEAEEVYIGDRIRDVPEVCSLAALRRSRNPKEGMSTRNLWGRFHDGAVGRTLPEAAREAIRTCTRGMLGATPPPEGSGATVGLAASRAFAEALPGYRERPDATWIASFNARAIEKFGNGGGNFRRLYAGFLDWAHTLDPKLVPADAARRATDAADAWTAASAALFSASESNGAEHWDAAARAVEGATDVEEALFGDLADGVG